MYNSDYMTTTIPQHCPLLGRMYMYMHTYMFCLSLLYCPRPVKWHPSLVFCVSLHFHSSTPLLCFSSTSFLWQSHLLCRVSAKKGQRMLYYIYRGESINVYMYVYLSVGFLHTYMYMYICMI